MGNTLVDVLVHEPAPGPALRQDHRVPGAEAALLAVRVEHGGLAAEDVAHLPADGSRPQMTI